MIATWVMQARRRQERARREPERHRPEVIEEFGRWLDEVRWSWFVTLTFPNMITPEHADLQWRRWVERVEMWLVYRIRGVYAVEEKWRQALYPPSLRDRELALHDWRLWCSRIDRTVGHRLQWARALEYQRRGVIHFHALLAPVASEEDRSATASLWRERTGGRAEVQAYRPHVGGTHYLGKYIAKNGEVDYGGPGWNVRLGGEVTHWWQMEPERSN